MQHIISNIITASTMIVHNLWSKMNMQKMQKQPIYIEKAPNHLYRHK